MYKLYLTEKDMLKNSHFPAVTLFNEAANQDIVEFFKNLCNGTGSGFNFTTCYFWEELDEFEKTRTEPFEGLYVETESGENILLSYEETWTYMKITALRVSQENENLTLSLNDMVERFCSIYVKH